MTNAVPDILAGKSIIITGIGPAFGRTLALEAAKMGARVSLVSRSTSVMGEVVDTVRSTGGEAIMTAADITSEEDCARVAQATLDAFGAIDGLVNSAYRPGDIESALKLDLEELQRAFDVTVVGTMRMTRAVVPAMTTAGRGAIVNIGSQVARKYIPGQGGYGAIKSALSVLSRHLAAELGPLGIRVNTPAFGWTVTEPVREYWRQEAEKGGPSPEEAERAVADSLALRVVPDEVECARAALLFVSDLTKPVTGATLDINGGDYMPL
jgi:NAD(P)-dependent dehydrogenase (short-subunit alcohol dehydrogenase family)